MFRSPQATRARFAVSTALVAGLIASLTVLPQSPAAAAGKEPAFGTMFHVLWSDYSQSERIAVLDKLADANIKWVRIDIGWTSLMENGRGEISSWFVDMLDEVVDAARERDIEVLAMFWRTPSWANGGAGSIAPPDNVSDYADALSYLASRYKGRIAAWEIWNEVNHDSFWNGSVSDYVRLLKAAYPAVKAADPSAQVVLGGPSYNDTDWIRKVYNNGGQGSFDVMATHPYQGIADAPPEKPDDGTMWTLDHVGAVYNLMKQNGDGNKPIWFTEFGWSSHSNWSGIDNWERGVSKTEQGEYAVRTLKFLAQEHPYVTNVFWYNERNRDEGDVQLDNYGLLERDLSAKPGFTILKDHLTSSSEVPTSEPAPEPEPLLEDNLLANGDFQSAEQPWTAKRAKLEVTANGFEGGGLKVKGRKLRKMARSELVTVESSEWLRLDAAIRGKRDGQKVKVTVVEKADGVLARTWSIIDLGSDWDVVSLQIQRRASGASEVKVKFKMLAGRGAFLVDEVLLSESS